MRIEFEVRAHTKQELFEGGYSRSELVMRGSSTNGKSREPWGELDVGDVFVEVKMSGSETAFPDHAIVQRKVWVPGEGYAVDVRKRYRLVLEEIKDDPGGAG
jgi:hypothetical protein